eukprot:CAMPEP_0194509328 /NCGR_PEP_ID=MMETSP0253-20130528/40028_1 /TAXON_ID=2966 /ORGANISM="Noctiluca scintillans" /LENGTH=116 /DNA_ID=CAMNT_0039352469 /DNA_START=61 /DNA_END=411 /DNA_ORIENTATION=+
MWWSHARHVACRRGQQLNTWAFLTKTGLGGSRTLSAVPLMRLCSEMKPPQGFAEQRAAIPGPLSGTMGTDALDEEDDETESAVSAVMEALAAVNAGSSQVCCTLFKMNAEKIHAGR